MYGISFQSRQMAQTALLLLTLCAVCIAAREPDLKTCLSNYHTWPNCEDTPFGYECRCGPGFEWNTYLCMSTAVDSRLEYSEANPVRYTLLLDIPFPELWAFTVTLWMNVPNPYRPSTIFSYKHNDRENFMRLFLDKTMGITMCGVTVDTTAVILNSTWTHFALSWDGRRAGRWTAYINGRQVNQKSGLGSRSCMDRRSWFYVPSGGEFVLGQSSRTQLIQELDYFDSQVSFIGSIAHVNLWDYEMSPYDVKDVYDDCTFSHCGNAVTWVEFRAGTRGPMRLRWPSGIQLSACYTGQQAEFTCDKYCSHMHGVQCKEQTKENMIWLRAPANTSISVPCPGHQFDDGTFTAMANRSCQKTVTYEGVWDDPQFDDCISPSLLQIKKQIQFTTRQREYEEKLLLEFVLIIHNLTSHQNFTNPMDISTVIDCLDMVIEAQRMVLSDVSWLEVQYDFAHVYPTVQESLQFAELFFKILDIIIDKGQEIGWNETKPAGAEGDEFIKVMEKATHVTITSLLFHIKRNDIAHNEADFRKHFQNSVVKIRGLKVKDFVGISFPSVEDTESIQMSNDYGFAILPEQAFDPWIKSLNLSDDDYIGISTVRYSGFSVKLPNHNVETASKDDNVNSVLFGVYIHVNKDDSWNLSRPISVVFNYTNTFNISNPACVRLRHGNSTASWSWVESGSLKETSKLHARCEFFSPGLFAITTDMYDVNWNKGDRPPELMTVPSYIGCATSIILCTISLIMLLYLRTSSPTTSIHKNFSFALICCQLTFVFGITQIHDQLVCRVFAILFHYFFLTQFTWLMNEAFNLYIVITYTAHSHGQDTGGTSKYRYYILGWVLPGVLVGAFAGSHPDDYYAPDMCWIAWEYIWLFLGPPMGIVCVSMLVLTFTAKEQNESSYAKDETANKVVQNHTRALWTQMILLNVLWSFAFLSLKMRGPIMKYLFALFNVLQGSFFLVFYFLLNEEVRSIYRNRRIRKNLAIQGYELTSSSAELNQSKESLSANDNSDAEHTDGACGNEPLVRRSAKGKQGRKERMKIETRVQSLDNLSDSDGVRQTAV